MLANIAVFTNISIPVLFCFYPFYMKALQELVQLIDYHSSPPLIKNYYKQASKSKQAQLFVGIKEGRFRNDREACQAIYGPEQEGKGYYKLKHDLRERLLNTVIQIYPSDNSNNKSPLRGYKYLTTARILLSHGRREAAVQILHSILLFCRQNEQTMLEIEALRLLRYHYGIILGDQAQQEKFNYRINQLEQQLLAENQADHWWEKIQAHFVGSQITSPEILQQAHQYEQSIEQLLTRVDSNKLVHRKLFLRIIYQMGNRQFLQAEHSCREGLQLFSTTEAADQVKRRSYLFQLCDCYLQLHKEQEFQQCFVELADLIPEQSTSWFRLQLLHCQHHLSHGNFQEAIWVWENVESVKPSTDFFPDLQESWLLIEAYLSWLVALGEVMVEKEMRLNNFKLGKFLNEVPVFSKDKKGYNIPILVVQVLFLLQRGDSENALNRIKGLYKYSKRHLQAGGYERTLLFIQMLLRIPRGRFRSRYVRPKAENLIVELADHLGSPQSLPLSLEVIPYEMIWELLLESGIKY